MTSDLLKILILPMLLVVDWTMADEVTFSRAGDVQKLEGWVLEEPADGSILFQSRDGRIWELQASEVREKAKSETAVAPYTKKEMGRLIRDELGKGFRSHDAGNFVLIYNTEEDYARWIAGLYRKLRRGFGDYWRKSGLKLNTKPQFPLPVLIFRTRAEYLQYMQRDLGQANESMLAYYNFQTNRVVMFDLTATQARENVKMDQRRITQVLSNPRAVPMVATVIHEGTHQLMFNYGMQVRYSDTPLWLNEGLAMYFETPDMKSSRGWRKIGGINFLRLQPFLQFLERRPQDSLRQMIKSDEVFRRGDVLDNYSQAWAFTYFLLNRHRENFVEYLQHMSKKPILIYDKPEQRVSEFEELMKKSIEELDREFVQYMKSLNQVGQ